jgi:hypothetical protein
MDLTAAGTPDEYARPKPLEIICYHAQQCAEKMLKGFLVANSVDPPKKHDLPLLCDMCIETDGRFSELSDICDFLTVFGVFHPFLTTIGTVSGPHRTLEQKSAGLTGKYQAVFPPSRLGMVRIGNADADMRRAPLAFSFMLRACLEYRIHYNQI